MLNLLRIPHIRIGVIFFEFFFTLILLRVFTFPSDTFQLQLIGYGQEQFQPLLVEICFTKVEEV